MIATVIAFAVVTLVIAVIVWAIRADHNIEREYRKRIVERIKARRK